MTEKTMDCDEIHLRMALAHDKACTSVAGNEVCGIITCSRLGHDLKVWNPKNLDLWIHINQLKTIPDKLSSHPNPVIDKQIEQSVSQINDVFSDPKNSLKPKEIVVNYDFMRPKE